MAVTASGGRRLPPKTVDFLNSDDPFPSLKKQEEEEVGVPLELEICDAALATYSGAEPSTSHVTYEEEEDGPKSVAPADVTDSLSETTAPSAEIVIRIPKKWKVARDSAGNVYYYHTVRRVSQWEPPTTPEEMDQQEEHHQNGINGNGESYGEEREEVEVETMSTDDEDEDEDDEEESDEEKEEEKEEEPLEERELTQDQDLSASEKKMLLRIRDRSRVSREERSNMRKLKRRKERQRREEERELIQARNQRHRDSGLVEEHLVPKDKSNASTFKEIRERLLNKEEVLKEIDKEIHDDERREQMERAEAEKQKREAKRAEKRKAAEAVTTTTTTAAADTSSDVERRAKDRFVKEMSAVIVKTLDPFRNPKSKGYIKDSRDFKYLAKKLTYQIFNKEKERVRSAEELKITEKMKNKAAEYVKKKMKSYDKEYKRSPQPT